MNYFATLGLVNPVPSFQMKHYPVIVGKLQNPHQTDVVQKDLNVRKLAINHYLVGMIANLHATMAFAQLVCRS